MAKADIKMKALILAAGFSTRLKPLTNNFPKGLLQIKGQEIIDYLLTDLTQTPNIDNIALITNTICFSHYHKFISSNYPQIEIIDNQVRDETKRLGAIGDLQFALDKLDWQDDLLVLPSDTLVSIKIKDLLNFYKINHGFINVARDCHDINQIRSKLGCVHFAGNKLTGFEEKPLEPKSTFASVPIYIYPKKILGLIKKYIETGQNLDSPGAIIPWLIRQTPSFVYKITDGYYFDIGTKEMLEKLNQEDMFTD